MFLDFLIPTKIPRYQKIGFLIVVPDFLNAFNGVPGFPKGGQLFYLEKKELSGKGILKVPLFLTSPLSLKICYNICISRKKSKLLRLYKN